MGSTIAGMAKQIVGMVNAIVLIAGLVGTALSVAMIFFSEKIADLVLPFIKDYLDFGGSPSMPSYSEIPQTLKQFGYILVAISAPLLVVGLIGCCGICFKKKPFLYLYTVVSILLCSGVVAVTVLWQQNTLDEKLFDKLGSDLRNNYAGVTSLNQQSLLLNVIQVTMKCCGLENYTDFEEAKKWDRTYNYTDPAGQNYTFRQIVPATCCVLNGTFPNGIPSDTNCTIAPTSINSYKEKSCRKAVSDALYAKEVIVIIVLAVIAAIEAISALLSIYLIVDMKKKEKEKKAQQSQSQNPSDGKNANGLPENMQNNPYGPNTTPGFFNPNDPSNPNNGMNPYAGSPYMGPPNAAFPYGPDPYSPYNSGYPMNPYNPYQPNMMRDPYEFGGTNPAFGGFPASGAYNPYSTGSYERLISPGMRPPPARRPGGFPQRPMRGPPLARPGWRPGYPMRRGPYGPVKRFNPYNGWMNPYGRF